MAEVAGLVLSGVAVASLFKTCLEFVEYFEDGRDWMFDFGSNLTKIDLLKTRLNKLEDTMFPCVSAEGIGQLQGAELPHHPAGQAISSGLKGVDDILKRASQLRRRYSHNPRSTQSREDSRLTGEETICVDRTSAKERPGQRLTGRILLVALRVTWVAYDKRRFDTLISDFDFFLSNLEIITSRPPSPLESPFLFEAHGLHSPSSASTAEAGIEDPASHITNMPSKPEQPSDSGSHRRHPPANSGQRRQSSHPASHRSVFQVNTTLPVQASSATNTTSSKYAENRMEGNAMVTLGDERGPSERETGNYYLNNHMGGDALVLAGRVTEASNQSMINAWVNRNSGS